MGVLTRNLLNKQLGEIRAKIYWKYLKNNIDNSKDKRIKYFKDFTIKWLKLLEDNYGWD
jgi:hypothetical protein